jgi:hypothetical protein
MFLAKISGHYTFKKEYGGRIHWIEKCICGCVFLGVILTMLIGPFFMFSNLSFISEYNLVTNAQILVNLKIDDLH